MSYVDAQVLVVIALMLSLIFHMVYSAGCSVRMFN